MYILYLANTTPYNEYQPKRDLKLDRLRRLKLECRHLIKLYCRRISPNDSSWWWCWSSDQVRISDLGDKSESVDHVEVDKDACLAKCVHCKRTYKVNKTTLTNHIQIKHPTKLVVPLHDSQRRPGGEMTRVLQLLGVNIQYQFGAALLKILLLNDQPFSWSRLKVMSSTRALNIGQSSCSIGLKVSNVRFRMFDPEIRIESSFCPVLVSAARLARWVARE